MAKIRITKISYFEMAHALSGYDGLCKNIHGHSYQLHVTVIGDPEQNPAIAKKGMLMDFSDLKQLIEQHILSKYDHALVLNNDTDPELTKILQKNYPNILMVDFQPTSEQLLIHFVSILKHVLPAHISLHSMRLYETQHSYAEWFSMDN